MVDGFVADRMKAGASNGEINRELAIVKRAFALATRARKVHTRPFVEMLPEAPPRARFFEHGDFERVCGLLPPEIAALARFCYITGWRWKSAVRPLTWAQINMAADTITIDAGKTKGGEPRIFVMTSERRKLLKTRRVATDALELRTGKPCALVFHRNGEPLVSFYGTWRAASTAAKVPGRLLHDLRRTAIRNLVRAGVSESVAMKMCGHKTRAIFDRYNVSSEKDLHAAAALLSAHHKHLSRQASTTRVLRSWKSPRQRLA